jgi:hypothetical protein
MIRINLLGGERQKGRKALLDTAQQLTLACSLVARPGVGTHRGGDPGGAA